MCILVLCAILPLDVTVNFNPYNCAVAEKLRNICLEDHMCLLKCCMNVKTKIFTFSVAFVTCNQQGNHPKRPPEVQVMTRLKIIGSLSRYTNHDVTSQ